MLYDVEFHLTVAIGDEKNRELLHLVKTALLPFVPERQMQFIFGKEPVANDPYAKMGVDWDYFWIDDVDGAVSWDARRNVFRCELDKDSVGYVSGITSEVLEHFQAFGFTEYPRSKKPPQPSG